jgi:hypothetical protein
MTKVCNICGEEKPLEAFWKAKANRDGYNNACIKCKSIYHSNHNKKWRQTAHAKELKAESTKRYLIRHLEKRKEYRKTTAWKSYIKEYRQSEHYKNQQKEYREKHKEERRISNAAWMREYRKIPQNGIKSNLRTRINYALNAQNATKQFSTMELLGCTIVFLKDYLEFNFKEGMSWDNHTVCGWHIDHIIPCDAFDLTDPEQQKQCFHYTNLQPLWWYENLAKGAKIVA